MSQTPQPQPPPPPADLKDVDEGEDVVSQPTLAASDHAPRETSSQRLEDLPLRSKVAAPSPTPVKTPQTPAASTAAQPPAPAPTTPAAKPAAPLQMTEVQRRAHEAALRSVRGEMDFLAVPDWVQLHPLLGAYLAEAIGTFAFVLTIALVNANNNMLPQRPDTNVTCLPLGFILMSMVFTFGYISGGHFNPAVTFAVFLAREIDLKRAIGYIICQCGASLGAGLVAMIIQGSNNIIVPHVNSNSYPINSFFGELIYTFALATVVLHTAYSRQRANFFYGFAIGMTFCAGSAAAGNISGGSFNPAVATGLQVALCLTGQCGALMNFWLYWLAPIIGAIVASIIFGQMYQPQDTAALSEEHVLQGS